MKRLIAVAVLFTAAVAIPSCPAQDHDHFAAGIFADYFRLQALPRDLFGVGGRLSFFLHSGPLHGLALEAEMAYDPERGFAEPFVRGIAKPSFQPSNVRALHGLFGPKVGFGSRRFRPFLTAKGGFLNIGFTSVTAPLGFTSAFTQLRNNNNANAVFYPGGGIDTTWGPIGLRLDAGDLIYFQNGANHNLRIAFGPQIKF